MPNQGQHMAMDLRLRLRARSQNLTVEEDRVLKVVRTEEFRRYRRHQGRRARGDPPPNRLPVDRGDHQARRHRRLHLQRPDPRRQQLRLHAGARRRDEPSRREGRGHEDRLRARLTPRPRRARRWSRAWARNRLPPQDVQQHLHENDDDRIHWHDLRGMRPCIHRGLCNVDRDPHGHDRAPLLLPLRRPSRAIAPTAPRWRPFASTTASCSTKTPRSAARRATPATRTRWRASRSSPRAARSSSSMPS